MRAIDGDILEKKLKDAINMCVSIDTSGLSELKAVLEDVEEMPTIEPEPHWIPCSKRLPRKNGFYLCTTKDCITILEFIEGNPHYHEEPSFVSDVLGKCNSYVVAWMPLPEPYRGEGEK